MKIIRGIAASPGLATGPIFQLKKADLTFERRLVADPAAEWERYQAAGRLAVRQLETIYDAARNEVGDEAAQIFQAQLLMLDDPDLLDSVQQCIVGERRNAESALMDSVAHYVDALEALDDEYLRARANDVRDVAARVLRALLGVQETGFSELRQPSIVVADDLTPSDTAVLDKSLVLGFGTARGGATSHAAILARSMGLPAVAGLGAELLSIPSGALAVLDGEGGLLHVDPTAETIAEAKRQQALLAARLEQATSHTLEPAITRDGRRVHVLANIGGLDDARAALVAGAEGVGLLRTEFLYMRSDHLPTEEEQYQAYRQILEAFGDRPVILRTLDVGGDKTLPYFDLPKEDNPFLGQRGIRLCLARPELIKPQLRAALRAGLGHDLRLMFPMIADVAEVRAARQLLQECRDELAAVGVPVADQLETGIMVEVPAAALNADALAREVDFFSIGTNDLSQYTLAADRTNAHVAGIASAFHPSVLRLIGMVIEAAHRQGKTVGMCGELAGEPEAAPILLGLGLDEFSMNAPAIALLKALLRDLSATEMATVAVEALSESTPEGVRAMVRARLPKLFP